MNESSPRGRNDPRREPVDEPAERLWDEALRRARRDAADRADARRPADAARRVDERARLEHLLAALTPILRRIPDDADLFDIGVAQGLAGDGAGAPPRLFLDMIGFVECAPEGGYRLAQATRRGRLVLGEARDLAGAMRLVADYVARRLVEREAALAGDRTVEDAARRLVLRAREDAARLRDEDSRTGGVRAARQVPAQADPAPPAQRRADARSPLPPGGADETPPAESRLRASVSAARARWRRWRGARADRSGGALARGLVFAVQFLGSAALTLIVALAAWWAWKAAGLVK